MVIACPMPISRSRLSTSPAMVIDRQEKKAAPRTTTPTVASSLSGLTVSVAPSRAEMTRTTMTWQVARTPAAKAFPVTRAARGVGVRATCQVIVVLVISALLGATLTVNPLKLLATVGVVVLGTAFFSCLSMTIAGLVLKRDRLMGIGQAITMPLFFASNALYPIQLMPHWLQTVSRGNPLSYEVDALRGLLTGTPARLPLDIAVLTGAAVTAIAAAAALLGRLAR